MSEGMPTQDAMHERRATTGAFWLGWPMVAAGIVVSLFAKQLMPDPALDLNLTGWAWICGGIMLVAGLPDRIARLSRRQFAAVVILAGVAAPFLTKLINSSLGAH